MRNTYKVFDLETEEEIMLLREDSACLNRICCAPGHTYDIGMLGIGEGVDVVPDDGFKAMTDRPVLMHREGCCSKLLCCFSCMDMCANHADVLTKGTEEEGNRVVHYTFKEKLCNGCSPEIVISEVTEGGDENPVAIIQGPTFFGGCGELCCDYDYTISVINPGDLGPAGEKGDICTIEKKKPEGCCACITEAFTDVDNYELHFNPDSKLSSDAQFKTVAVGAVVYLDFMFFEFDNGICDRSPNGGLQITLFNCYVFGCICPCTITLNSQEGGE